MEPLGRYLLGYLGYLSYPRYPHSYWSQAHRQLPSRMVAIAVSPKLGASPIAMATQGRVHFFLQHRR